MNKSLVILAAGAASRYGGNKQLEVVGPSGETLSDYAVYNAIRLGFKRVIFIIRKEKEEEFRTKVCKHFIDKIEVCFAYQELDSIPLNGNIPEERVKMLGTTHALLCAEKYIDGPFVLINADDFNSFDTYNKVNDFFENNNNENEYVSVNYPFIATFNSGKVKRAVVSEADGKINNLVESEIGFDNDLCIAKSLTSGEIFEIDKNAPVSVNFFGFKKSIFEYLRKDFEEFSKNITIDNECLLPFTLQKYIKENEITLFSKVSNGAWFGLTYKEDLPDVQKRILKLIDMGEYPNNLWS